MRSDDGAESQSLTIQTKRKEEENPMRIERKLENKKKPANNFELSKA